MVLLYFDQIFATRLLHLSLVYSELVRRVSAYSGVNVHHAIGACVVREEQCVERTDKKRKAASGHLIFLFRQNTSVDKVLLLGKSVTA